MIRARSALLAAACGVASCHRSPPAPATIADAEAPPVADAQSAKQAAVLPPRCKAIDPGLVVDDPKGGGEDLEIGDAVVTPSGLAVGVVHRTAAGRVAAVALLPSDARSVRVRDLGPTLGDAPPPRVAVRGSSVLAVAYGLSKRSGVRAIDVYTVSASGDVAQTGSIDETPDDSLVVDVSPDRVVWDEATHDVARATPRGVIRTAEISADGRPAAPHDASTDASDADTPRIVASPGGTFVFWIARRPEAATALDGSAPGEVTGEARGFAWVEAVRGSGPVRRLTSANGHVSAYDVALLAGSGAGDAGARSVVLVARDDGESAESASGSLLKVRVGDDTQDPPVAFPIDDLGRGAPDVVEGDAPWLSWTGAREEARLLPLDGTATPTAPASAEPGLDDGRALVSLPAFRLLVATPGDPVAQIRMLACTR
jgi:hypothetical protein